MSSEEDEEPFSHSVHDHFQTLLYVKSLAIMAKVQLYIIYIYIMLYSFSTTKIA